MTGGPHEAAPADRTDTAEVAGRLAELLEERRAAAETCARELERPHGPAKTYRVSRYRPGATAAAQRLAFDEAFDGFDGFLVATRAGDPGALETGLEILSRFDPAAALPIARALLELGPWLELGNRIGAALARVDDPAAVELALVHVEVPYVASGIGHSICGRASASVVARLEASPAILEPDACERRETMIVEELLRYLGAHRVVDMHDTLRALYAEHPDANVRRAAGHALVAWGDAPSLGFLASFARDGDRWRRFFAVRALLRADPRAVLDALGGPAALEAPEASALAGEVLEQVAREAREAGAPIADPRMLDLALAWVKQREVKDVAQWVLSSFDPAEVKARKRARAKGAKAPRPKRPTAKQVAATRASMGVARDNLERIVAALRELGYRFRREPPLAPRDDRAAAVDAIEAALGGPLPVSLRAAFEILGGCDLTGRFPGQPEDLASDAFVLVDPRDALDQAEDEGGGEAQVTLVLAPDVVGKAGFSGGAEAMLVPAVALDGPVLGVPGEPLLLDRLREVFRHGGFPGLAGATGELRAITERLAAECEPLEVLPKRRSKR